MSDSAKGSVSTTLPKIAAMVEEAIRATQPQIEAEIMREAEDQKAFLAERVIEHILKSPPNQWSVRIKFEVVNQ